MEECNITTAIKHLDKALESLHKEQNALLCITYWSADDRWRLQDVLDAIDTLQSKVWRLKCVLRRNRPYNEVDGSF